MHIFKTTMNSEGNLREQMAKKRYEREYVLSNIIELKDAISILTDTMTNVTKDMSLLIQMHQQVMDEITNQNRFLKSFTLVEKETLENMILEKTSTEVPVSTEFPIVENIEPFIEDTEPFIEDTELDTESKFNDLLNSLKASNDTLEQELRAFEEKKESPDDLLELLKNSTDNLLKEIKSVEKKKEK